MLKYEVERRGLSCLLEVTCKKKSQISHEA